MKKAIRIVSFALALFAFCVFCCGPMAQSASAIVGVDDAIIAIIVAALAACGITFVTTGAFDSSAEYVESLMQQYAQEQNTSVQQQIRGSQYAVNSYGKILMNNRLLVYIDTLARWIKLKYSLAANSVTTLQNQELKIGSAPVSYLPIVGYRITNSLPHRIDISLQSATAPVYLAMTSSTHCNFISTAPFTVNYHYQDTDGTEINRDIVGSNEDGALGNGDYGLSYYNSRYYYGYLVLRSNINVLTAGYLPETTSPSAIRDALMSGDIVNKYGIVINTGSFYFPTDDPTYTPDSGGILDVGAEWGASLPDITEGTIPDEFGESEVGEATLTLDTEEVIEEQIDQELSNSVSQNPADYQVTGLEQVFPFCIPFDLYNFVEALDAPPEAPSFTWRFYVPGICDESIEIDLSPFDGVAQLLRTMELLLFCVGLAFVTRKIIRG